MSDPGLTSYPALAGEAEQEPLLEAREEDAVRVTEVERVITEHRVGDLVLSIVAYVGLLLFLIFAWILVFANNPAKLSWFAFHPTLQSLGIAILTLGILTLQPTATPSTKEAGLNRHQLFQIVGFTILTLGLAAILTNKITHHAAHFTTSHAWFGIIAYAWLFLQSAIGAGSVWFGGKAFGGGYKAKRLYKYHRASGYVLVLWLAVTVYLAGEWSDFARLVSGTAFRTIGFAVAPLLIVIGVAGRARLSKMKFF